MAGTATPQAIQSSLQSAGLIAMWNANDPLLPTYIQIADSYKTSKMGAGNFSAFAVACQIAKHVLYWKKTPGDCQSQTSYSMGPGGTVSKAGGLAGSTASEAVNLGGQLGADTTSGILSGVASAVPLISLATLPFTIWGVFTAHHAAAVQKEQASLCQIVSALNPSFDQLDSYVANGQMSVQQVLAAIEQMRTQAKNAFRNSGVYQNCNAACYLEGYMNCVCDIRKLLYNQSSQASGNGAAPSAPAVAASLMQNNSAFGIALAALAAHGVGVF